jgi:hypothetical protein
MADPAPADGRSGDIRWPIQHRLMADPAPAMADPAPADGRSGDIRWPIQHRLMADQATSAGRSSTG